MEKMKWIKKGISALLALNMVLSSVPLPAFAVTTDNLCDHHTEHTAECGYVEAAAGSPCTHIHDEACGYAEPIGEVLCACTETDDTGALVHTEGCGYVAPVAGSECTHAHDVFCGYVAAVEAQECRYACSECAENEKAPSERGLSAELTGGENPSEKGATGAEEVCTCGTDDPAIHATTCAVYVAPENPMCYCAEKCTEVNEWCDVCGFDISKCTGTDTAVVYAECTCEVKCAENNVNGECAVCSAEGADLNACIGTVAVLEGPIDATTMTADEMKAAVAEMLAAGEVNITIIMSADADMDMFTALRTALAESTVPDGSINLTISGVKKIPDYGFIDMDDYYDNDDKNIAGDKLKSLTLTDVETIGKYAFSACTYLESVNLPQVVTIGECAFNEWKKGTKLTSLDLPNATTIGDWAFAYSSLLTSINLPKVTSIGMHAFGYCDLRTLNLPEVTTIDGEAFLNNYNLVSCSVPKATTIDYYPWGNCSRLETLELTAAGGFTLGNNLFANTPSGQINLVLNKDKESQVTQNADGTATWKTTNSNGGELEYTFKSITFVYSIEVSAIENGAVTADKSTATEGETVTLTVTAAEGYILDTLTVMNGDTPVEVTGNSFTMPAGDVTVSATFKACDHTGSTHTSATDLGDGKHSFTCSVCDTSVTEPHSIGTDGKCACGLTFWTVEGNTLTIDGTLGGKETATEEDLAAMVELLRSYIESGNTTIIVTGNNQAKLLTDGYLTPVVSLAFEQLTYVYQDENIDSYWGTVDLIYQDVTEIVEYEFYVCDVLRSITLPKVTKVGDRGFWACYYLETLTFGSVVTDITDNSGEVFYDLGYKIGDCNLVLNCGQMNTETEYQPNLDTRIWWNTEWKSITLTHADDAAYTDNGDGTHSFTCTTCGNTVTEEHSGGTATCTTLAVCDTCGKEYGDVDKTNHDETVTYENGFCPNCDAYEPALLADGYYQITNAGQLYWFAQQVNIAGDTAANGKLMADIDLENRTWYPIGLYDDIAEANGSPVQKQYVGTFDGNNHTVSNFTAIGNGSQGLFGYCNQTQTQIKNLGVINATVSGWNAGAVAGYCANLTNCYAVGCTITGASDTNTQAVTISSVGGNNGATVITNCWAYNCKLIVGEGEENYVMHPVGGIRASNDSVNTVQNCYYGEIVTVATFTSTTGATEKTEAQFASGEVAYLLGSPFGQTIGTHSLPVLYGETVYYGYTSCADNAVIGYTNDPNASAEKPAHSTTAANDKAATCTTKAYCSVCDSEYGEVDTANHDETVAFDSNGFCPNGCYEPAVRNGEVYEISNAGQLYWFAQKVNNGETTINAILMNDIAINSQVLDADGNLISDTSGLRQWTPIGHYNSDTDNLGFAGTFDGNGKTISSLYHYGDTARYAGLFGYSAGTIRDLTIADAYIHTTHSDGRAGAVTGLNYGTVSICHNSGFVSGVNQVGGIVGRINAGSVENCSNSGTISGNQYVGGICGNVAGGAIRNCSNHGTVSGTEYIGGITGSNSGAIEKCSNHSTVSGNRHVGGIAALVSDGIINNCYNIGAVEATGNRAGGIAGCVQFTSNISNCFSSGTVKGSLHVGGVVGLVAEELTTNVKITNCYHDNLIYSGNAVGYNSGSKGSGTLTKVEGKTTEAFASGELTWLLNGESAEGIWKQTLDTDTYPSFSGKTVYCGYSNGCFEDAKFYTNNPEEATERADHTFDNGVCTVCGAYEPAADSDADGYYEIYNVGNLFWFAQKVNSGENTINAKLMADIDLENRAWTPMGTHDDTNSAKNCHFKGTFDGNYHIVKNLSVTVEDNCEAGFFGRAEGATIQNFGIVNARVEGKGGYRVGVIGGELYKCTVTNVFSAGEITLITDNAQKGGIAGESHSSTLNGCFTTYSNLTASANVTVTNCYYLAEEASSASAGMNMSANKFTSGELTWLLNGESAEGIWKQTLDTDTYPSFTGGTVYHGNCGGGVPYSNDAEETMNHTFNAENGYRCSNTLLSGGICNIYESAAQNADGYYEIYNASQLYWFAEQVNGGEKSINAVLMNDIDLTNHTWTPIGVTAMGESVTDGYTGTFDGQGHVISNITFAAPTSAMAAGIFGTVQSGGTVKNLGVENLTFDNNDYDHRAAGIAGQLLADSTISDCYVINSTVKASSRVVGGIVGMNKGTVKNCYTCNMTLAGYNNRFGGISGDYSGGKLENCYTDYSALASSEAGTTTNCEAGVSAERFASGEIAYALGNGWGQTIGTDGCPVFGGATVYQVANIGCPAQGEYVYSNVNEAVAAAHKYTNGFCACGEYEEAVQNADGYYVIDNAGKLFWFAELVNGGNNTINAVLTADIDLENRPWTPIGTQNESVSPNVKMPYMGVFDGQGHVIKNLSIHVTDGREAGLFGRAQDATLSNFGVVDAAVVSDPVNGTGYRAGIVAGELHRCTVTNVYSAGNLTVTTTHAQAGGIAGECADSTLTNCFTTYGCLTASNAALPAAVTNCYYLAESENTGSCGDYKTADQFASGEVAWLLNGSTDQGDLVWYQNIGMDAYPKFEGLVVNYNTESDTYHNGNTVSVSISWTEMSFTYTAGEWDPETHTYTGSWAADDGAAQITVKNVGAANVPVRFTFAGTMGEVTGRFDVENAALAPGRAATTTLTVSGDPQKSGFVDEQIGTVTVSLGSSGWTTGEKVTFYAKDGKDYPSTVAEVTDAKMVLVSDYVGIHWNYNLSGNGADGTFSYFQSTYLDPVGARFPAAWTAEYYNFVVPYIENHQSHIICVYSRGNKRLAVWADQVKVSSTFQNLGHIAYFYIWDVEFAE